MGAYFGIQEAEDLYIWEVADMALSAPLLPGWSEVAGGSGVAADADLQFK